MMGLIACVESVPVGSWPRILEGVGEAGISIDESGELRGLPWCTLSRGRVALEMAHEPTKGSGEVYIWCGTSQGWRRPLATRRLMFEVVSIIKVSVR